MEYCNIHELFTIFRFKGFLFQIMWISHDNPSQVELVWIGVIVGFSRVVLGLQVSRHKPCLFVCLHS